METPNLSEIHDYLIELAFKAGDIINNALPETSGTGAKKNSAFISPLHPPPTTNQTKLT
jgi:myo-inositol-1(or 4)-monophosphatase